MGQVIQMRQRQEELLTKAELVRRLGLSERWVERHYHGADPIPSRLIPGRGRRPVRRFPWSEVNRWIDRRASA